MSNLDYAMKLSSVNKCIYIVRERERERERESEMDVHEVQLLGQQHCFEVDMKWIET